MKYIRFFCALLFLHISVNALEVTDEKSRRIEQALYDGVEKAHEGDYDACLEAYRKLRDEMPKHPVGYFYHAAALFAMIEDYRNYSYAPEFEREINLAVELGEQLVKSSPKDPWSWFYRGGAYGYRGVYNAGYGSWWRTLMDGMQGYEDLAKAKSMKNDLYDADYGIGMYYYWKSETAKNYYWLPFLANQKTEGIQHMLIAVNKGRVGADESALGLLRVYITEGWHEKVIDSAEELLKRFPGNITAHRHAGKSHFSMGNYEKSENHYAVILELLEKSHFTKPIAIQEARFEKARAAQRLGRIEEAKTVYTNILASPLQVPAALEIFKDFKVRVTAELNAVSTPVKSKPKNTADTKKTSAIKSSEKNK